MELTVLLLCDYCQLSLFPGPDGPLLFSGCDDLVSKYFFSLFSSQFHLFCIIAFGKQFHRPTACCMESHLLFFVSGNKGLRRK